MTLTTSYSIPDFALSWQEFQGKRVVVHAMRGTYAATKAATELREAEAVIESLEKGLELKPDHRTDPIALYLTDPVPVSDDEVTGYQFTPALSEQGLVRILQPDAPAPSLAESIVQYVIPRWLGNPEAIAPFFLIGVAGVLEARLKRGPTIEESHEWVRSEQAAGRKVTIFTETPDKQLATSFVHYLITQFSLSALWSFLKAYDPQRRDHAALLAYQQPLGALEEAWLAHLVRPKRRDNPFKALFRYLIPLVKPFWWRQAEALLLMLVGVGATLIPPLGSKYLIDTVLPGKDFGLLLGLVGGLLAVDVVNAMLGLRRTYLTAWVNGRILTNLQSRMFTHLQQLPHQFYSRAKVGDLMTRLSSDIAIIQSAMSQVIGVGVFLALRAVVAAGAILFLSPTLGLLVLVVVPLFALTYASLRSRLQAASYAVQKLSGEVATTAQENLVAQGVTKAFGLAQRAVDRYKSRLDSTFKATLSLNLIGALFDTSMGLAIGFGQLVVFAIGGYFVIQDTITLGTLIAFISLLPSLLQPIAAISGVGQAVERASGSLERVTELLDEPLVIQDAPDAVALPPLHQTVTLDALTFSYEPGRPILNDLNLTIPAGTHVAIVGPSGSGKSTVVNMVMRFWDPDSGRVLFDGHDLRNVTLDSLREQIGIVFQDTFVFDTTLRENIAIGRVGATDDEVLEAAKAAQLESYIASLPAGLDTVLGERGVRMSGGQRQRLAIARAILRDPRLLILDEATSALDAHTEREILETLVHVAQGRTTISITHRLSLAAAADWVVVLQKGQVAEQGTHSDLVKAGGLYQALYEEQHGYTPVTTVTRTHLTTLKAIPLFAALSDEALRPIAEKLTVQRFAAGETIVREGDIGDRLYLIKQGQAGVYHGDMHINTLVTHDYFGELTLLERQQRTATVKAMTPTEVYMLHHADFLAMLGQEGGLRQAVGSTMAARWNALVHVTSSS